MGTWHPIQWRKVRSSRIIDLGLRYQMEKIELWLSQHNMSPSHIQVWETVLTSDETENKVFWIDLGYDWPVELRKEFEGERILLSDLARWARRFHRSYRGFDVGAAILVVDKASSRLSIMLSANCKLAGDLPKWCAELAGLMAAVETDHNLVLCIIVSGPLQADGRSGYISFVLHPCELCRDEMSTTFAGIVQPWTPIISVGPGDEVEEMKFALLRGTHDER